MPIKPGFLKNPLTYAITAGALAAPAAGVTGYHLGKRKGATSAANIMADAFDQANQIENSQLANYYFNKGLSQFKKGSKMDKQAVLNDVYNAAFEDEIEKIAGPNVKKILGAIAGGAKKVWDVTGAKAVQAARAVGGAYATSAKGMAEELGKAKSAYKLGKNYTAGAIRTNLGAALKKGRLVLGTGAGVAGGTTGGVMFANRKKD